jgi:hypothetical protein
MRGFFRTVVFNLDLRDISTRCSYELIRRPTGAIAEVFEVDAGIDVFESDRFVVGDIGVPFRWVVAEEVVAFVFHLAFGNDFGIRIRVEESGGEDELVDAIWLHVVPALFVFPAPFVIPAKAGIQTGGVKTEAV